MEFEVKLVILRCFLALCEVGKTIFFLFILHEIKYTHLFDFHGCFKHPPFILLLLSSHPKPGSSFSPLSKFSSCTPASQPPSSPPRPSYPPPGPSYPPLTELYSFPPPQLPLFLPLLASLRFPPPNNLSTIRCIIFSNNPSTFPPSWSPLCPSSTLSTPILFLEFSVSPTFDESIAITEMIISGQRKNTKINGLVFMVDLLGV
uniref:Transmembrane protein n=1 Tax=Medicago truncatula TaxID=3880 RepID=I3S0J8_MEDTR|nr:unknown [Medicago truncatula]